jgi:aromatic-ring opening dioxygenase LigAB LigA subunit
MSLYELSRALYDLREPQKRDAFVSDTAGYAKHYAITEKECELLLKHDARGLTEMGVSIYLLTKMAGALKVDFLEMEASIRGTTKQEFVAFLSKQAERNQRYNLKLD